MLKSLVATFAVIFPSLLIAASAPTPRQATTGISRVTLFADDIPKSAQFYGGLLGWKQLPATPTSSGTRFYANHSQYSELVSPPAPSLANRLDIVAFSTTDAETWRKYLGANGVIAPQ